MNFNQSNTSSNDIPNAESTKIEKTAKTPLKRLRMTLANRLGLHSNPNSPSGTPQSKRNSNTNNTPTLSKLDPQVYLDTQSNGFASRVVKYHDASVAKNRIIANKVYRRPGDFPIVNFDKSEINLNQKQANAPTVSKINIAPPINLVSASNASARSTIFRTGKNYGESYSIGKLGPIEARKPIKAAAAAPLPQDEPIVPTNNDYDSAPVRSSLEALKEISRKRIHCDEIDGDTNKKQRADNDCEQNNTQVVNSSKRTRDRTSPSFCSSSADVQKKRYRNNDILSSLSSSILMSTPKRSALNVDVTAARIHHPEFNYDKKDADESPLTESCAVGKNISKSSRVGTSNSDLPLNRPSEPIKPVIKSMSDGYVPGPTTKANKLTLFNKVYSAAPSISEKKKSIDDDEENLISFVKPKVKASSIFGVHKNRDQKSKLAMMLSFLRGDESKDEVDSVEKSSNVSEKSNQKEEQKTAPSTSTSANLNTSTSVTFSTATTTSLLSAPSDITKSSTIESPETDNKNPTEVSKSIESIATPVVSISTTISTTPSSTAATATSQSDSSKNNTKHAIKPTVTFNLPATTAAISTANTSASDSAPRLGGFSFSATSISFISPLVAKPATTESPSIARTEGNKPAPPSFSFGLSKSTTNSTTVPAYAPPAFGSNTLLAKTEVKTASTQSSSVPTADSVTLPTTSTPASFSFGSPTTKSSVPVFGLGNKSSNIASNANSTLNQAPLTTFAFGNTTNASKPESNTSITSASTFAFGTNTPTTSAPVFGSSNTITSTVPTNGSSLLNQSPATAFSFGGAENANKPQTAAFQFGNTATTNVTSPALAFGSPSVSTPLFGASTTTNSTSSSTSTAQSGAFTFGGANKPNMDTKPLFGSTQTNLNTPTTQSSGFGVFSSPKFGETNATTTVPAFGSTVTTTGTTNVFGNAQNTPVFGSSNISTETQPKTENIFAAASNQTTNTPVFGGQNQNQSNAFGKPPSVTAPTFGANNNLFGSQQSNTQSSQPPAFGTSNNSLFSTQTTSANLNQTSNSAFGSPTAASSGVFAFGQTATQTPATTASTGIFGTSNTNTSSNAPFVFGQGNTMLSTTPSQPSGIFGTKPVESSLTAPPAFGSTSPAFNFSAKPTFGNQSETKPSAFSFNAPNNNNATANVPAFGSSSATPQFGATTNGIGSSFSFSAPTNNQPEASKPFAFGGPSTAPAAPAAPFSFNAPNAAPAQNAFQFNAAPQQPTATATNMFSIGPGSGMSTTKTGRPMRTATRRTMK